MKFLLPALVLALAALAAACANSDAPSGQLSSSTALPPTSTPTITPTPTPGAGEDQALQGELVPDWPADFPVPEGAEVIDSERRTSGSTVTVQARFLAPQTLPEVGSFYSDTFSNDPWRVLIEQVEEDSGFYQFTNSEDERQSGFLSLAPAQDAEGVVIQVQLGGGEIPLTPTPDGTPAGTGTPAPTATPQP